MPRVIHFEINADEPERAAEFYSELFGWKVIKDEAVDYWLLITGEEGQPGIDGGIRRRMSPDAATVNSIEVPSVDDFLKKVVAKGGRALTSRMTIPGVGYMAYCMDTEGNSFGLFQEDRSAVG